MFSIRVKELRERAKLSQKAFAKNIQITQSTYALYELGKREPSLDVLCKISDYFKVSVDYLLGREMMYVLPGKDDYESVLSKYGPIGDDIHDSFVQLLNSGIALKKPAEVSEAIIKLKTFIRNLDTATSADFKKVRETVKQYDIPLLGEIMLDGSVAHKSENPSNMLYMLSYMSYGIDKAILAKSELSNLLDELLRTYTTALLSLRFRLAAMKKEVEQEAEDKNKQN